MVKKKSGKTAKELKKLYKELEKSGKTVEEIEKELGASPSAAGADQSSTQLTYQSVQQSVENVFFSLLGSGASTGGTAMASDGTSGGAFAGSVANLDVSGSGQVAKFLSTALAEVGYHEGNSQSSSNNDTKYGKWIGCNYQPWCASYVSWCANEAGVGDIVGKSTMANGFMSHSGFTCQTEVPHPGDLLIWTKGDSQHVGIVTKVEGDGASWTKIQTVEGNSGDAVVEKAYTRDNVNKRSTAYFCTPPWTDVGTVSFSQKGETADTTDGGGKIT